MNVERERNMVQSNQREADSPHKKKVEDEVIRSRQHGTMVSRL